MFIRLEHAINSIGAKRVVLDVESNGFSVLPITSLTLAHELSGEHVSTGIAGLDEMFSGKGYFRGSSILVLGTPRTGKSSMAAHFADALCARGRWVPYFAFEESDAQIVRNMRSIGMDLAAHRKKTGRLRFAAARPTLYGLEAHLVLMHWEIVRFKRDAVVVDPINNLVSVGDMRDVRLRLVRPGETSSLLHSHPVLDEVQCSVLHQSHAGLLA